MTERTIEVTTFDFTEEQHEALFDAIADVAHEAGDVVCSTSLTPTGDASDD